MNLQDTAHAIHEVACRREIPSRAYYPAGSTRLRFLALPNPLT